MAFMNDDTAACFRSLELSNFPLSQLASLPPLTSLRIDDMELLHQSAACIATMTTLTHLTVPVGYWETMRPVWSLRSLPCLQELGLIGKTIRPLSSDLLAILLPRILTRMAPPVLRTLTLEGLVPLKCFNFHAPFDCTAILNGLDRKMLESR